MGQKSFFLKMGRNNETKKKKEEESSRFLAWNEQNYIPPNTSCQKKMKKCHGVAPGGAQTGRKAILFTLRLIMAWVRGYSKSLMALVRFFLFFFLLNHPAITFLSIKAVGGGQGVDLGSAQEGGNEENGRLGCTKNAPWWEKYMLPRFWWRC